MLGLLYHAVASEPMPWWPDTVILGAAMAGVTSFAAFFWGTVFRSFRHLKNAGKNVRSVMRTRLGLRGRHRALTAGEQLVLAEVRARWGDQNTAGCYSVSVTKRCCSYALLMGRRLL